MVPSQNGAVVILQHGYKSTREELLNEAEMLYRHGYGVLLTTVRAHDYSEGVMITFGMNEVQDMDAWYQYLLTRDDIDTNRIGILGNSFGGMLVIQYAAQNENIKAVVADSAFSSLNDTVSTSVTYFTDLPSPLRRLSSIGLSAKQVSNWRILMQPNGLRSSVPGPCSSCRAARMW